jgi:threonine/homoserine/homoserine lactone efflux protein
LFEFLLTGAALGLAAGLTPGPGLALVISQSIRYGRREGAIAGCAPLFSDLPIVAVTLFILARLQNAPKVMAAISLIGAAFVIVLAVESSRAKPLASPGANDAPPRSLLKAVALNFLNPHVYLFWAAVGAPAILRGAASGWTAPAAFLTGFYSCLVGSKVSVAILVAGARGVLGGRGYVLVLRGLGAALLILAGFLLRDGLTRLGFVWS